MAQQRLIQGVPPSAVAAEQPIDLLASRPYLPCILLAHGRRCMSSRANDVADISQTRCFTQGRTMCTHMGIPIQAELRDEIWPIGADVVRDVVATGPVLADETGPALVKVAPSSVHFGPNLTRSKPGWVVRRLHWVSLGVCSGDGFRQPESLILRRPSCFTSTGLTDTL